MQKSEKNQTKTSTTKKDGIKKSNNLNKIIAIAIVAAVILFLVISNLPKKENQNKEFMFRKDGELTFIDSTNNSTKAKIDIQIADNDFDRELGLMFRKSMEENQGMLFIFPFDTTQNFWMRNTYIPLDMIFVNSKKEIVTIQHATQTLSDQTYSSSAPAMYVIEVDAGFSDKYKIKAGDKISWQRIEQN
ncbi:MAG: DUF192 domain-containing protein [Ignavibacteriaceae bacterium]